MPSSPSIVFLLLAAAGSLRLDRRHAAEALSVVRRRTAPAARAAPAFCPRPSSRPPRLGSATAAAATAEEDPPAAADGSSSSSSSRDDDEDDERDRAMVTEELGYLPPNFLRVSGRTRTSLEGGRRRPVAIQTYPLNGGAARRRAKARGALTPFPTLYWLCNAEIGRAVADLERRGYVKVLEARLRSSGEDAVEQFRRCHDEYGRERWGTLTEEDRAMLEKGGDGGEGDDGTGVNERMVNMIRWSGVAGTDYSARPPSEEEGAGEDSISGVAFVPSVKCLHAHYAHYRSGGETNIVGMWTHEILTEEFPDLEL